MHISYPPFPARSGYHYACRLPASCTFAPFSAPMHEHYIQLPTSFSAHETVLVDGSNVCLKHNLPYPIMGPKSRWRVLFRENESDVSVISREHQFKSHAGRQQEQEWK